MYEALIAHLRECAKLDPSNNTYAEAADAIESLQAQLKEEHDALIELQWEIRNVQSEYEL